MSNDMVVSMEPSAPNNRIMIEAEAILDIDFGVLYVANKKYNNPKFIDQSIWDLTKEDMTMRFLKRKFPSPLSAILTEDCNNESTCEKLFNDMWEQEYSQIIEHSEITAVTDVIYALMNDTNSQYKITIVSDSKMAYAVTEVLKGISNGITISVKPKEEIDLMDFDTVIVKDYRSLEKYKKHFDDPNTPPFIGVNIIGLGYAFNLVEIEGYDAWAPRREFTNKYAPKNSVSFMDVYKDIKL